jgi:hypothetical protein
MAAGSPSSSPIPNGAALAAILAAGIGCFAMGAFVIANAAGWYAAPSLYAPAGGLSGRATFALIVWFAAWAMLHARWKGRDLSTGSVVGWTLVLVALSLVLTFPPVWELF